MKGRKGCMNTGGKAMGMKKASGGEATKGKKLAPLDGEVAHRRVDKILRSNGAGKPSNVAGNAYKASEGPGSKRK